MASRGPCAIYTGPSYENPTRTPLGPAKVISTSFNTADSHWYADLIVDVADESDPPVISQVKETGVSDDPTATRSFKFALEEG